MPWAINEGYMSNKLEGSSANCCFLVAFGIVSTSNSVVALHEVLLVTSEGLVASWGRAFRAFVDLGICIPKLNSRVSGLFALKLDSVGACNGFYDGGLSVRHMPNSSDIKCSLPRLHEE